MGRIAGLNESNLMSADTLVKNGKGYVFQVTIGYKGVTAGETCTIKDGISQFANDEVVIIFPAANGTLQLDWSNGKEFDTGIFWNKGATAGQMWCSMSFS